MLVFWGQISKTMAEYVAVPAEDLSLLMKKLRTALPDTLPVSVSQKQQLFSLLLLWFVSAFKDCTVYLSAYKIL